MFQAPAGGAAAFVQEPSFCLAVPDLTRSAGNSVWGELDHSVAPFNGLGFNGLGQTTALER
jgi:hypothetical protein